MTKENFENALTVWLANAQEIIEKGHERFKSLECPTLETMYGRRYVRVVRVSQGSRSVHCFVDKTNGDVLKADSWKKPTKNFARGNIFTKNLGVGEYGAHYAYR